MSEPRRVLDPANAAAAARVVHAAVTVGVIIVLLVFMYLGGRTSPQISGAAVRTLRLTGYGLLLAAALASGMLRGRVAPRRQGEDVNSWWVANLGKAIPSWALAEGGAVAPIVIGWLIGDTTLMALGAAVPLALLFVNRPGRLQR